MTEETKTAQRSPVTVYVQGPMIRSAMTGGMVRAHADLCSGADDHTGLCPVANDQQQQAMS